MGRNNILENHLGCVKTTCNYTGKITEAAAKTNKAMFKPSDVRRAREELEGFEPVD